MNWNSIQEKSSSPLKYIFVSGVIIWGLTLLDSTANIVKVLALDNKSMQGDYSRLSVGTNEIIRSLHKTNADVAYQSTLLQSNNDSIVEMLKAQQKQLDGIIEYLKKTQPEHKAILQSYTGKIIVSN